MSNRWIDISVTLHSGMVHWPGDPPVVITRTSDLDRGDPATVSKLSMGSHTGTHMDAPRHFIRGGKGLDDMPLETAVGPARVVLVRNPKVITPEELRSHQIRRGERILLKTRNSARCWKADRFLKDFVSLSPEAARFLAQRRVRMVGVDYLSVGSYRKRNGVEVHRTLLRAGIWILEGLNLSHTRPATYELLCLPLRIAQSDGAPARAILRPMRVKSRRSHGD